MANCKRLNGDFEREMRVLSVLCGGQRNETPLLPSQDRTEGDISLAKIVVRQAKKFNKILKDTTHASSDVLTRMLRSSCNYAVGETTRDFTVIAARIKTAFWAYGLKVKRMHEDLILLNTPAAGQGEEETANLYREWQRANGVQDAPSDTEVGAWEKVLETLAADDVVATYEDEFNRLDETSDIPEVYCKGRYLFSNLHIGFAGRKSLVDHFMKHAGRGEMAEDDSPAKYARRANEFISTYSIPEHKNFCNPCLNRVKRSVKDAVEIVWKDGEVRCVDGLCRACEERVQKALVSKYQAVEGTEITWKYKGLVDEEGFVRENALGVVRTTVAEGQRVLYAEIGEADKSILLLTYHNRES